MRKRTVVMVAAVAGAAGLLTAMPAQAEVMDVVQQVGEPVGGCAMVVAPSLNWAGVASGGWTRSWAQWVNEGRGGTVCTRTLTYSDAMERWVLAP